MRTTPNGNAMTRNEETHVINIMVRGVHLSDDMATRHRMALLHDLFVRRGHDLDQWQYGDVMLAGLEVGYKHDLPKVLMVPRDGPGEDHPSTIRDVDLKMMAWDARWTRRQGCSAKVHREIDRCEDDTKRITEEVKAKEAHKAEIKDGVLKTLTKLDAMVKSTRQALKKKTVDRELINDNLMDLLETVLSLDTATDLLLD